MKLLKYEGFNITFEPELLTLKVFKKLHQRDKTKDKNKLSWRICIGNGSKLVYKK